MCATLSVASELIEDLYNLCPRVTVNGTLMLSEFQWNIPLYAILK